MFRLLSLLVFATSLLEICEGYGSGAPPQACINMTPGHLVNGPGTDPILPQADTAPYTVSINKDVYGPGEELQITISGTETFIGFLLQGRPDDEDLPVGDFSELDAAMMRTVPQCSSEYEAGAITHTDITAWTAAGFTVKWTAPDEDVGNIIFYATVAKDHDNFWVKIPSESIAYSGFAVLSPTVYMILLPLTVALSRLM